MKDILSENMSKPSTFIQGFEMKESLEVEMRFRESSGFGDAKDGLEGGGPRDRMEKGI